MKTGLDEILFEHRNKEYGAYHLRKNFGKNLSKATIIGSLLFSGVLGGAFAFNKFGGGLNEREVIVDLSALVLDQDEPEDNIIIPEEEIKPLVEEQVEEFAQEKFLPPEPMKDELVKFEEPPPNTDKLEVAIISSKTVAGAIPTSSFTPPPQPEVAKVVKIEKPAEEEVYMSVEQQPQYPGGDKERKKFLERNLRFPTAAQSANISGIVQIQFVVERDGSISGVKVLKSLGFGCDEAAMEVVKKMPRWTPGMQNGKPVRVYFQMPFVFRLGE